MPAGLEVWDASGVQTLSVTDRLTRILGTFNVPGSPVQGSINIPELALGDYFLLPLQLGNWKWPPYLTVSGTTVSWLNSSQQPSVVIYGLY